MPKAYRLSDTTDANQCLWYEVKSRPPLSNSKQRPAFMDDNSPITYGYIQHSVLMEANQPASSSSSSSSSPSGHIELRSLEAKRPKVYAYGPADYSFRTCVFAKQSTGERRRDEMEIAVMARVAALDWWYCQQHPLIPSADAHTAVPPALRPFVFLLTADDVVADQISYWFFRAGCAVSEMKDADYLATVGSVAAHSSPSHGLLWRFERFLFRLRLQTCLYHRQRSMLLLLDPPAWPIQRHRDERMGVVTAREHPYTGDPDPRNPLRVDLQPFDRYTEQWLELQPADQVYRRWSFERGQPLHRAPCSRWEAKQQPQQPSFVSGGYIYAACDPLAEFVEHHLDVPFSKLVSTSVEMERLLRVREVPGKTRRVINDLTAPLWKQLKRIKKAEAEAKWAEGKAPPIQPSDIPFIEPPCMRSLRRGWFKQGWRWAVMTFYFRLGLNGDQVSAMWKPGFLVHYTKSKERKEYKTVEDDVKKAHKDGKWRMNRYPQTKCSSMMKMGACPVQVANPWANEEKVRQICGRESGTSRPHWNPVRLAEIKHRERYEASLRTPPPPSADDLDSALAMCDIEDL